MLYKLTSERQHDIVERGRGLGLGDLEVICCFVTHFLSESNHITSGASTSSCTCPTTGLEMNLQVMLSSDSVISPSHTVEAFTLRRLRFKMKPDMTFIGLKNLEATLAVNCVQIQITIRIALKMKLRRSEINHLATNQCLRI